MQALASFRNNPGLEYLNELSRGSFGVLWLARVVTGSEIGRLVVARRLPLARLEVANASRVLAAAHNYSTLSHPSLAKILGAHKTETELILVEEHVIGVTLNKLQDLAIARQISVPIGVSVKLVLDVLRAAAALRRGCSNQNLSVPGRTIFPDAIIVANFGEALLTGVGVTEELGRCRSAREHPEMMDVLDPFEPVTANGKEELYEIFTAGAMLWKLLVIRSLFNDYDNQETLNLVLHSNVLSPEYSERLALCVPKPIVAIIRSATQSNHGLRYQSLQEMISAIEGLPSELLAPDTQVRTSVESIAGDFFSGLQHSSGVRRIALDVRSTSPVRAASHRISHIDTLLPGMRAPLAVRMPPLAPPQSAYPQLKSPVAPSEPNDRPAIVVTPGLIEPFGPKRRIRAAYVIGTFMGLGLSLGLSFLSTQFNSAPTSTASTLALGQESAMAKHLSQSEKDQLASRADTEQDSGTVDAMKRSQTDAPVPPQTKATATPGAKRDHALGSSKDSKRLSPAASPAGTSAKAKQISSNRNRWGI